MALAQYRFVVAVAHRRFGKTECAIECLTAGACAELKPHGMYGYIAPYLKQAKAIAWRKLKRRVSALFGTNWREAGVTKNEAELWVQFPNGARIQLFGADNADAMRGLYFDGIVIDEIADMKSDTWNGVIRPALADRLGWALFIGTPKGLNQFYKFYNRGLKDPYWKSLMFSATTTKLPWLPPSEIKALQDDMTEAMFRQEMLCDFQASSDDVLFKLDLLHNSINRQMRLSDITGSARIIGFDIAGPGKDSDKSVLTKKEGLLVWPQKVYRGMTTPELCDVLASEMVQWKADGVIVDMGYGFAIVEQMHRRGFSNVYGVHFNNTPIMPHYSNKKTEMAYRVKAFLDAGGKIPNDAELIEEMSTHTVGMDEKGKLTLLPKPKVKEIIKRSPDKFDSLMLAHAFDIQPIILNPLQNPERASSMMIGGYLAQQAAAQDYDPYNNEEA